MIIVLTSLSIKESAQRVETVADSYLTRISASTWIGAISGEGLEDIRLAITKHASRHTIVSCFRVRGTDAFECAWQVGSRKRTTAFGTACVSQRKKQITKVDAAPVFD